MFRCPEMIPSGSLMMSQALSENVVPVVVVQASHLRNPGLLTV